MGADMQQQNNQVSDEAVRDAWMQAIHEWLASGEAFTANRVLARRDEILAGR
jgi:hypothetical protein